MMAEDPIPQEVLIDYQNRTVVSVANLRWANAQHTMLDADVLFAELEALGPVPFSTTADADTAHGREVWDKANAGDYGPIAAFSVPLNQQITDAPEDLFGGPTLGEVFHGN
ncbi:hypothetical protein NKG99_20375 [Mesorhizobium sp. M1409]|uniref:hypothetical protein n=1 Tax=Mesorhizobium sp. M1409 TaxID=2957100 RepID=UPI0033365134